MSRHGGVQSHVRDLSAWLRAQGHQVRILSPVAQGRARQSSDEIGRARKLALNDTSFEISWISSGELASLTDDLTRWGAEIAHFHTPCTPLMPLRLWRALAVPRVATFHSTPPDAVSHGVKTRIARQISGWFLRRADAAVFPASPVRDLFGDLARRRPPIVLPPSVDLSPWRAVASDPRDGVTGGGPSIAYLGRLEPRKGLDTLLAAWPQVEAALPHARLLIAGDGSLKDKVLALAQTSPRLRYLPAPDDASARQILARSDFLVAPAAYGESFGIVLIEAMAAGALPVAAANPGFSSVLTGPGAELLFPLRAFGDLAARLIALAGDPDRCKSLRQWGQSHAQGFDIATQGPRFAALYHDVLASCAR
jgi:phosphatidylinositol alpha-mannosyltransferase